MVVLFGGVTIVSVARREDHSSVNTAPAPVKYKPAVSKCVARGKLGTASKI
jgi:hypothetical protein